MIHSLAHPFLNPPSVVTFHTIQQAAHDLKGKIERTPLVYSPWLSEMIGSSVHLKLENMQLTGSFKIRGAYTKLLSLTAEEKKQGVITMSAGNHALGVSYYSKKMNIPTTVIMPEKTQTSKIEKIRDYGAVVILHGENIIEARDFALQLIKKHHYTLIHPFEDAAIVAGHGTLGLEMLEDLPDLDILVVPIGGGGLASGICIAAKAINPKIQIIGVQTRACSAVARSLFPNSIPQELGNDLSTLAEGLCVETSSEWNLGILREHLDNILLVDEKSLISAIESLALRSKTVSEASGAAGVAAVMSFPDLFTGHRVGIIVCGGNIESRLLSNILLQGLMQKGKFIRFKITASAGSLGNVSQIITKNGGSLFEMTQDRSLMESANTQDTLYTLLETRDNAHAAMIRQALCDKGFPTEITD